MLEPPDGTFELMAYRSSQPTCPPPVQATLTIIQPALGAVLSELEVIVHVQTPRPIPEVEACVFSLWFPRCCKLQSTAPSCGLTTVGTVSQRRSYGDTSLETAELRWCFRGQSFAKPQQLRMRLSFVEESEEEVRAWATSAFGTLHWRIPQFTVTGMKMRFFKVQSALGYKPTKWIRYLSCGHQLVLANEVQRQEVVLSARRARNEDGSCRISFNRAGVKNDVITELSAEELQVSSAKTLLGLLRKELDEGCPAQMGQALHVMLPNGTRLEWGSDATLDQLFS